MEITELSKEDRENLSVIIKTLSKEINDNNWEEVYRFFGKGSPLRFNKYAAYTGIFTEMMRDVGINPLLYMKAIPQYYARGNQIESIYIPDNIISIQSRAFENCTELKEVSLPKGLRNISFSAFFECESLTRLTFRGTKEETANISFLGNWRDSSAIKEIECTDGVIKFPF